MANPPPSGPHSDLSGVNRDARAGDPSDDPAKGTAKDKQNKADDSKARPARETSNY